MLQEALLQVIISQTEHILYFTVILSPLFHAYISSICRARVLSKLQQLKTLDLSVVSGEEMVRALNLYRLDGGDLEARQGVHTRHFPGEPFIDQFETFEDDEL